VPKKEVMLSSPSKKGKVMPTNMVNAACQRDSFRKFVRYATVQLISGDKKMRNPLSSS
jgi:hypothetical protein